MENSGIKFKAIPTDLIYKNPFDDLNKKIEEETHNIKELNEMEIKKLDLLNKKIDTNLDTLKKYYNNIQVFLNISDRRLRAHIGDTRSNLIQINTRISSQMEIMKEIVSFQQTMSNNLYILSSMVGDIREYMKLPWYKRWFKKLK